MESAAVALNAVGRHIMAPLVVEDASQQAHGLIALIDNRPECAIYKMRLREAGRGAPAAGSTQWAIGHAYSDARQAGCVKPQ
ncbi:MAG TPA: hypothetical protein VMV25_09695 [Steroidobacteraceae bacterium]|nr:hypothetical protein [Steroidobacteraceae bacterium]